MGAMLRVAWERGVPVRTSAAVVAQVWRNGTTQARLARTLTGVSTAPLDGDGARATGILLAKAAASDVVDAHLALQVAPGEHVLTSDPEDLASLLLARGVQAVVVRV